jgi:four helix bundle protein
MSASPHPADAIEDRMIDLAVRVMQVADALPPSEAGRHVAKQVLRCGTSPAANYAEARGAESRADFIHKLKIVQKELNETSVWLRVISRSKLIKATKLTNLLDENIQLSRIVTASVATARARNPKRRSPSDMTND